jgi:hypothetical protein
VRLLKKDIGGNASQHWIEQFFWYTTKSIDKNGVNSLSKKLKLYIKWHDQQNEKVIEGMEKTMTSHMSDRNL